MSSDNNNNNNNSNDMARQQRRGSMNSTAFSSLFRSNSVSQNQGTPALPGTLTSAALNEQRRRLSITTLGLSGTSPPGASASASTPFMRRASMSTNSDSIDENAVEDDDIRTGPTTPFTRRMSFGANQAMRGVRGGTSPGSNGRPSPPIRRNSAAMRGTPASPPPASAGVGSYPWAGTSYQASSANQPKTASDMYTPSARSDQGFNWSDQLRSRAESTVNSGSRASFSFASGLSSSPPRSNGSGYPNGVSPHHDRARSVSDMPAPPATAPRARVPQKPDPIQERILKGDFYMD